MVKVDFHIHSYYSDGTKGPVELVRDFHDDEYDMIVSIKDIEECVDILTVIISSAINRVLGVD